MNGGVVHCAESLAPDELAAACRGFEYFGLTEAAQVLNDAGRVDFDSDDPEGDELEEDLDNRYWSVIPSNDVVAGRFEEHYRNHPEEFAPL